MSPLRAVLHERGYLPTEVDARLIADVVGAAILDYTRTSIEDSTDPYTGGPKPQLSKKTAAIKGRLGRRGYRSGEMTRRLALRTSGSSRVSSAKLSLPSDRIIFLRSEARRGIPYLSIDGKAAVEIDRALDAVLEEAIR